MRLTGFVPKGWGSERIWVSTDKYCSKFLHFDKNGLSSFHFHRDKHEHWYVMSGVFSVTFINFLTSERYTRSYKAGSIVEIGPMIPHRVFCVEEGEILEVSTPDSVEDNYRIEPGDSQKEEK